MTQYGYTQIHNKKIHYFKNVLQYNPVNSQTRTIKSALILGAIHFRGNKPIQMERDEIEKEEKIIITIITHDRNFFKILHAQTRTY